MSPPIAAPAKHIRKEVQPRMMRDVAMLQAQDIKPTPKLG